MEKLTVPGLITQLFAKYKILFVFSLLLKWTYCDETLMLTSTHPFSKNLRARTRNLQITKGQDIEKRKMSDTDEVIYDSSHNHRSPSNINARNRTRTLSNSSNNHDRELEDNNNDISNGYLERVVIVTDDVDDDLAHGDEDSGISCEEHLLREEESVQQRRQRPKETLVHVAMQVSIPFLIAGLGMMLAGLLLDKVQVS